MNYANLLNDTVYIKQKIAIKCKKHSWGHSVLILDTLIKCKKMDVLNKEPNNLYNEHPKNQDCSIHKIIKCFKL